MNIEQTKSKGRWACQCQKWLHMQSALSRSSEQTTSVSNNDIDRNQQNADWRNRSWTYFHFEWLAKQKWPSHDHRNHLDLSAGLWTMSRPGTTLQLSVMGICTAAQYNNTYIFSFSTAAISFLSISYSLWNATITIHWGSLKMGSKVANFDKLFLWQFWSKNSKILHIAPLTPQLPK